MKFLEKIYELANKNGYTGLEEDLLIEAGNLMENNNGVINVMEGIYGFLTNSGMQIDATEFEDKYWKFFGKRPNDR